MKTFKQFNEGKMKDVVTDYDFHPDIKAQHLGHIATAQRDKEEIARQKEHLADKAKKSYEQSEREGGGGAARAKGVSYEAARDNIKEEDSLADQILAAAKKAGLKAKLHTTTPEQDRRATNTMMRKRAEKDKAAGIKRPAGLNVYTRNKMSEETVNEEGGMSVAGIAGSGDARLPTDQREPGVSKKRNPVMKTMVRRLLPKV